MGSHRVGGKGATNTGINNIGLLQGRRQRVPEKGTGKEGKGMLELFCKN